MELLDQRVFAAGNGVELRAWGDDAREGYARLVADPRVMTFISDGQARARERANAEVAGFNRELADKGWSRWAVHCSRTGAFCGYTGFALKDDGIDFGQRLFPSLWRSRLSRTAAQLALEYGFLTVGFDRIHTLTRVDHILAIRSNRNYLGVGEEYGVVCQTPNGPHLRIDVTREMFLARLEVNRDRIYGRRPRPAAASPEPAPSARHAGAMA